MNDYQLDAAFKVKVMQAFSEGKEIQCRVRPHFEWMPTHTPSWDWLNIDYRVKPAEPRIVWMIYDKTGAPVAFRNSESEAEDYANGVYPYRYGVLHRSYGPYTYAQFKEVM